MTDMDDQVEFPSGSRLNRWYGRLTEGLGGVGTLWFFALMLLISAEVVGRELFSAPIRGVTEIAAYSVVGATFLQLPNMLFAGRMTRADFLFGIIRAFAPLAWRISEFLISIAGAVMFALLCKVSAALLVEAYTEAEIVGLPGRFSFQVWPLRLIVVLGSGLTALGFGLRAVSGCAGLLKSRGARGPLAALAAALVVASLVASLILAGLEARPDGIVIGAGMFGALMLLVLLGVHVGVALMATGFVGLWLLKGRIVFAENMLGLAGNDYLANYFFSAVPLFVLMGLLVSASDIGRETFDVARWLTRHVRGGLGIATIAANAIFAAITGSSVASASVYSKVAAPEMIRHGYTPRFAVGTVAGSSVLGMLIPPSLLLIVYGFLSEQSVGHLFVAAVLPGLMLTATMVAGIFLMATFRPDMVHAGGSVSSEAGEEMPIRKVALQLSPIIGLIVLVLGGIYGGFFTPTEGGAIGSLGALVYAIARHRITIAKLWTVIVETGQISTSVLFLILSASVFTRMLASSGLVQAVSASVVDMNFGLTGLALVYVGVLIVLGMFLESISIMLIVVPIVLPAVAALGGDPIWFGILTVIAVEIGLLTPPFGLTCYVVIASVRSDDITLADVFRGAFPFVICMLIVTGLIIMVPSIAHL